MQIEGCYEPHGSTFSRRSFLQSASLTAGGSGVLLGTGSLAAPAGTSPAGSSPSINAGADFLANAKSTADWILSVRTSDEFGAFFPPDPDEPAQKITVTPPETIYSGMAGTVLFLAELAHVTGEERYREAARAGAERLLVAWPHWADTKMEPVDARWSLNMGVAGTGMVLHHVGKLLSEPRFSGGLSAIADRIVKAADHTDPKGTWTEYAGIIADSSTVLYLLNAARLLGRESYRQTARKAGDRLLTLAHEESDGTLSWRGPQNPQSPNLYYPNFETGTAGVVFTLASLFEETDDKRFLEAAKRGAQHLMNIAVTNGKIAMVPYALPDHADLFYLGYCHGSAGTTRAFYKLYALTGGREYLDWCNRLAQGIVASGAPELESPGLWNTVNQCCGTASHVELFLGLWAAFGNPEHLALAQRAGRILSSRASNLDGKGDRWYIAWTRLAPAVVNAETGYMIGASGIGSALLQLQLAVEGRYSAIPLFDNPFPTNSRT